MAALKNWYSIWQIWLLLGMAGASCAEAGAARGGLRNPGPAGAHAWKVEVLQKASALAVLERPATEACAIYNKEWADTLQPADEVLPDVVSDPGADVAQPADSVARDLERVADSLSRKLPQPKLPKKRFVPNPKRALWLSLVFPGAGQIYNRKYWKLPIIYGGFLGCTYALMWNQQMYRDYSQAYLDIMDDDPRTDSYLQMLPPRYDITGREEQFKKIFKRKKDFYRRYRDLSAFCFVGVYLLSVVDAYVDAQLSEFDITPDLSLSVSPQVIGEGTNLGPRSAAYGIGCSFRF